MQSMNDHVFDIEGMIYIIFKDHPENLTYDEAYYKFITDYDRENPITKK